MASYVIWQNMKYSPEKKQGQPPCCKKLWYLSSKESISKQDDHCGFCSDCTNTGQNEACSAFEFEFQNQFVCHIRSI